MCWYMEVQMFYRLRMDFNGNEQAEQPVRQIAPKQASLLDGGTLCALRTK